MRPIIQVTLNFPELDLTTRNVKNVFDNVEWIGIGNSLIKSKGVEIIGKIKEKFLDATDFQSGVCLRGSASQPHKKIVADMRVIDLPLEVEIASRAGADIITVSGISDNNTLLECINLSRINGTEIIADLRNMNQVKDRAEVLEKLGVDYLLLDYKDIEEISDLVQIPIIAECPIDRETIAYAVESGAGIVELKLNNENDLRRFTGIKRAIRGGGSSLFSFYKDTPTREEFETITKEIESIKGILSDMEIRGRDDAEKRKRLDEAEKLEEQRRKIAEEWRKLKEVEIRWEKKIKENEEEHRMWGEKLGLIRAQPLSFRKRKVLDVAEPKGLRHVSEPTALPHSQRKNSTIGLIRETESFPYGVDRARSALMDEEEQRRMWKDHDQREERELKRIEDEWGKIKRAEEVIENQRRKIADEMKRIEREWMEIEKMTRGIEKKGGIGNVEEKVGERKEIIGESPMNMEIEGIEMHTERNIEDDLLRIKEEHKTRKELPKMLIRHKAL